jgi:WD domain, G-beta repeat
MSFGDGIGMTKGERGRHIGALGGLAAFAFMAAAGGPGCGSDAQSLVVVALTASPSDTMLVSTRVDVGATSKTFPLTAGLSDAPISLGVYVPSGVTGSVLVAAAGYDASGARCYFGSTHATVNAGGTTMTTIALAPTGTCAAVADGGAGMDGGAGSGGAGGDDGGAGTGGQAGGASGNDGGAGTGGASGTGGGGDDGGAGAGGATDAGADATDASSEAPAQVIPPSLTKCAVYNHGAVTCNLTSGAGDATLWSMAFSPDGSSFLSAGDDGRVKVWTHSAGVLTAEGHVIATNAQGYVAFSPDGKLVVIGSDQGLLTVYSTTTWTLQATLTGHSGTINGVGFSPDGTQIFAADASNVLTVHTVGGPLQPARTIALPGVGYVLGVSPVFSATDQWLGVGYADGTGEIMNLAPAQPARTPIAVTADGSSVYALGFSPDGKAMAAGGDDAVTSFWTIPPPANALPTGPKITTLDGTGDPQGVNGLAYSPDGLNVAVAVGSPGNGGKFGIWDASTRQIKGMVVPTYFPASVAWSPSGLVLAAGEYDCGLIVVCAD